MDFDPWPHVLQYMRLNSVPFDSFLQLGESRYHSFIPFESNQPLYFPHILGIVPSILSPGHKWGRETTLVARTGTGRTVQLLVG